MNIGRSISRIRLWTWAAMHYPNFQDFKILVFLPISKPRYQATLNNKEIIVLFALRIPTVVFFEPIEADFYHYWGRMPDENENLFNL
ncbi:MAG: hypothetical protein WBA07_09840 [Rivularia sp. (in: cyanobacteria)]